MIGVIKIKIAILTDIHGNSVALKEVIKDAANYSSFLNVVGNTVYYMDMDDEKAFINLVDVNNSNETKLHEWNYKEYQEEE